MASIKYAIVLICVVSLLRVSNSQIYHHLEDGFDSDNSSTQIQPNDDDSNLGMLCTYTINYLRQYENGKNESDMLSNTSIDTDTSNTTESLNNTSVDNETETNFLKIELRWSSPELLINNRGSRRLQGTNKTILLNATQPSLMKESPDGLRMDKSDYPFNRHEERWYTQAPRSDRKTTSHCRLSPGSRSNSSFAIKVHPQVKVISPAGNSSSIDINIKTMATINYSITDDDSFNISSYLTENTKHKLKIESLGSKTAVIKWNNECPLLNTTVLHNHNLTLIQTSNTQHENDLQLCGLIPYTLYSVTLVQLIGESTVAIHTTGQFHTLPDAPSTPSNFKINVGRFKNEDAITFKAEWKIPDKLNGLLDYFNLMVLKRVQDAWHEVDSTKVKLRECNPDKICKYEYDKKILKPNTEYRFKVAGVTQQLDISTTVLNYAEYSTMTGHKVPELKLNTMLIEPELMHLSESPQTTIKLKIHNENLDHSSGTIKEKHLVIARLGKLSDPTRGTLPSTVNQDEEVIKITEENNLYVHSSHSEYIEDRTPGTYYEVKLRYSNDVGFCDTNKFTFVTAQSVEVEVLYACVVLLLGIILIFITNVYRLTFNSIPYFSLPRIPLHPKILSTQDLHRPIKLVDLETTVNNLLSSGCEALKTEYAAIKSFRPDLTKLDAQSQSNRSKNRYSDILPYDHARVMLSKLPGIPDSDYINASYIHGYTDRCTFIAAQGPKKETLNDFWRMVWEKNVHVIVNLTKCIEDKKQKVEKYWEDRGRKKKFNTLMLEQINHKEQNGYVIRTFKLSDNSFNRTITQYHFTAWPDMKCPDTPDQLLNLVGRVLEVDIATDMRSPIVVHCSAGVGRTGTFISMYNLINEINDPDKDDIDVFYSVIRQRYHRVNMIQTEIQYKFLYSCVLDYYKSINGKSNHVTVVQEPICLEANTEHDIVSVSLSSSSAESKDSNGDLKNGVIKSSSSDMQEYYKGSYEELDFKNHSENVNDQRNLIEPRGRSPSLVSNSSESNSSDLLNEFVSIELSPLKDK